ncbi:MAG: hypothetical protein IJW70_09470 [Clostridia bacterium]|nr:hypothetical protein [Clostridia bacterium]
MNRKSSTVLIGSAVIGIVMLLAIYMGLIVTGVIDTRPSELVIVAASAEKEFDGEPLVCHEYTLKKGTLKKGHKIVAEFDAAQTNAGVSENAVKIKIVDSIGADVTNHYNIETRSGKLTVSPRKLVLKSGDAQKVYDGAPLIYEFWEEAVGKIPSGYKITATFSGSQLAPGSSQNTFTVTVRDQDGNLADRNFSISYLCGTLTVTKRPLTVTSYGASKIYDGTPLRYESYVVEGSVMDNHFLEVNFPASITDVGEITNNIAVYVRNRYADGSTGGDASEYYDISVRVGMLEVKPRPIEVSASPCIKHFSGSELPQGKYYITKGSLVEGHELSAQVDAMLNTEGTVEFLLHDVQIYDMQVDIYDSAQEHKDVTHNYEITLVHGIDRDQLESLVISSGSKSAPYTGEPLTCEQYVLSEGVLAAGHVIEPFFTGSQTEIGFSDNTFSVSIIDQETGEDVTYRYNIEYRFGTLEVYDTAPSTGGEIGDDGSLDNDVQNENATAARVWAQSSGRVYLRWKSYGNYAYRPGSGNWGWGEAMAYPSADANMLYSTGLALAKDGKDEVLYQIEILGNQFLIPNYIANGPEGAYNDVVLSPISTEYTLGGYAWNYSYADALRYAAQGVNDEQMKAYTAFVYAQYLDVPDSTRAALEEIAAQNGLKADRLSIIEDVASYVRTAAEYNLDYSACPEGKDEVIYFLTESKSGVCRHFASAATLLYRTLGIPARYVVGYSTYAAGDSWTEVKGADAHAWVEVFISGLGWVRIDPTPAASGDIDDDALVFSLIKVMGYYTGLPYRVTEENVILSQGSLQEGHVLAHVEVSGSRIEVGQSVSTITEVRIEDADGKDVTAQYNIVLQDGVIEVRSPSLIVSASSAKKVYDGEALTDPRFTYVFKNTDLGSFYTVTATVSGSQTEVGQSANRVTDVCVTDIFGNDVTSNFQIHVNTGTLKVYMYELSLSTESATKTYDGHYLSAPDLSYDEAALADRGHRLEYTMPSITNVGAITNQPTCTVLDGEGNDVTSLYDIRISAGVLRVQPVRMTIVTDSASKLYDGTALHVESFTITAGAPIEGERIAAYQILGSQTNVGVSEAMVTAIQIVDSQGRDTTANYQITIEAGTLSVLAP